LFYLFVSIIQSVTKIEVFLSQVPIRHIATEAPQDMFRKFMVYGIGLCPEINVHVIPCPKLPQIVFRLFHEVAGNVELKFFNPICYGFILLSRTRAIFNASLGNALVEPTPFVEPFLSHRLRNRSPLFFLH
jgi:hypothetical protein